MILVKLDKIHFEAIQQLFEGNKTRAKIAEELKVTDRTLYNWLNDIDFAKAQKDYADVQLKTYAPKAIEKVYKLLDAESESVQLNAAKDILDRTGFKPTEKIDVKQTKSETVEKMEAYLATKRKIDAE